MSSLLRPPDLIVYLRASVATLLERIRKRGRDYEAGISVDYLTALNTLYDEWAAHFTASPTLIVQTDALNIPARVEDLEVVIAQIIGALEGCVEPNHPHT
jgi:deoxyadenosine/deoxycytidine kinase